MEVNHTVKRREGEIVGTGKEENSIKSRFENTGERLKCGHHRDQAWDSKSEIHKRWTSKCSLGALEKEERFKFHFKKRNFCLSHVKSLATAFKFQGVATLMISQHPNLVDWRNSNWIPVIQVFTAMNLVRCRVKILGRWSNSIAGRSKVINLSCDWVTLKNFSKHLGELSKFRNWGSRRSSRSQILSKFLAIDQN